MEFKLAENEWAIFEGIEQEGPFAGLETLFVAGDAPMYTVYELCIKKKYWHIYFGAGASFTYNSDEIITMLKKLMEDDIIGPFLNISVESIVIDSVLLDSLCGISGLNPICISPLVWKKQFVKESLDSILNVPQRLWERVFVKIDTDSNVLICSLKNMYMNSYDNGYNEDKLLVRGTK